MLLLYILLYGLGFAFVAVLVKELLRRHRRRRMWREIDEVFRQADTEFKRKCNELVRDFNAGRR